MIDDELIFVSATILDAAKRMLIITPGSLFAMYIESGTLYRDHFLVLFYIFIVVCLPLSSFMVSSQPSVGETGGNSCDTGRRKSLLSRIQKRMSDIDAYFYKKDLTSRWWRSLSLSEREKAKDIYEKFFGEKNEV